MLSPLVMATLLLFLLGAAAGLLLQKLPALANRLNSGFALLGSLAGLVAAIQIFAQGAPVDGQLWLLGSVHLDMLAALMLLVISTVGVAVALYSFAYIREYQGKGDVAIGALMNLFLFAMVGMVLADNALGFLLCYELVTLTTYWLVKTNPDAAKQSRLYLVMNHIGMALVLVAFWLLCRESGSLEFAALREHHLAGALASLVFLLSFCGFGLRAGFVPLHGWLPDAHSQAPTAGSVDLAGILLKTAAYGLLRFALPLFPEASAEFAPYAMLLGLFGIIYGALLAFAQTDIKRLVAYTSISHMGFVMIAIYSGSELALQGAVVQMIAHGLSAAGLFILCGQLYERLHTRDLRLMGGLWGRLRYLPGVMLFFSVASLGMPGTGNFVGEFLILIGSFQVAPIITIIATFGLVLASVYSLIMLQRACFGTPREESMLKGLDTRELTMMLTIAGLLVLLGLYPQPVLDTASSSLLSVLHWYALPGTGALQ